MPRVMSQCAPKWPARDAGTRTLPSRTVREPASKSAAQAPPNAHAHDNVGVNSATAARTSAAASSSPRAPLTASSARATSARPNPSRHRADKARSRAFGAASVRLVASARFVASARSARFCSKCAIPNTSRAVYRLCPAHSKHTFSTVEAPPSACGNRCSSVKNFRSVQRRPRASTNAQREPSRSQTTRATSSGT
jgi:hypothetical protein